MKTRESNIPKTPLFLLALVAFLLIACAFIAGG